MALSSQLKQLKVDMIIKNPENPRIVFRQEEMDKLFVSIKKYGVQVPISVYKEGNKFALIDGERRWRTSKKLNLSTIPAIIHAKPSPLDNLLLMFNIHALREQWDLFTTANKITRVIELLTVRFGYEPNEIELSDETGLKRGTIRRCRLLIELPERFKDIILKELEKPKAKQKLTEDFFIEMESALKTVMRNIPEILEDKLDDVRDKLIEKYSDGTIMNIVDFRKVAKLATSPKNVDYPRQEAASALSKIFEDDDAGIEDVYNSTVNELYDEKRLVSNFNNALNYIHNLTSEELEDEDINQVLRKLKAELDRILDVE
jgi:ParB family transcriptional regulator, chromosome partitioning protein